MNTKIKRKKGAANREPDNTNRFSQDDMSRVYRRYFNHSFQEQASAGTGKGAEPAVIFGLTSNNC